MALRDPIELVGHGEHDMPVRDVEQIGALAFDPSGRARVWHLGQ